MKYVARFIRGHIVFAIATALAIITAFIIPPDSQYLDYVDFKTLACLFSTLCVHSYDAEYQNLSHQEKFL